MIPRPRRRLWLKLAAGLLFAVVAAYAEAYVLLVSPLVLTPVPPAPDAYLTGRIAMPVYRVPEWAAKSARRLFAPAHWVDLRLRPRV